MSKDEHVSLSYSRLGRDSETNFLKWKVQIILGQLLVSLSVGMIFTELIYLRAAWRGKIMEQTDKFLREGGVGGWGEINLGTYMHIIVW